MQDIRLIGGRIAIKNFTDCVGQSVSPESSCSSGSHTLYFRQVHVRKSREEEEDLQVQEANLWEQTRKQIGGQVQNTGRESGHYFSLWFIGSTLR